MVEDLVKRNCRLAASTRARAHTRSGEKAFSKGARLDLWGDTWFARADF